jgi:hypothetical protein
VWRATSGACAYAWKGPRQTGRADCHPQSSSGVFNTVLCKSIGARAWKGPRQTGRADRAGLSHAHAAESLVIHNRLGLKPRLKARRMPPSRPQGQSCVGRMHERSVLLPRRPEGGGWRCDASVIPRRRLSWGWVWTLEVRDWQAVGGKQHVLRDEQAVGDKQRILPESLAFAAMPMVYSWLARKASPCVREVAASPSFQGPGRLPPRRASSKLQGPGIESGISLLRF